METITVYWDNIEIRYLFVSDPRLATGDLSLRTS